METSYSIMPIKNGRGQKVGMNLFVPTRGDAAYAVDLVQSTLRKLLGGDPERLDEAVCVGAAMSVQVQLNGCERTSGCYVSIDIL